jgi:phage terminase large subunit-like protein
MSTQGDSEESLLGTIRKASLSLPTVKREGCYTSAYDKAGSFYYHEWSLRDNDDYEDFALVKEANPLSIHTPETLRKRYQSTTMELWQWLRFTCGIAAGGENSAFDAMAWRVCGDGEDLFEGEPCWIGMDIGWRKDSSALVPFVYDEESDLQIVGVPTIIPAPNDGSSTSYKTILDAIRQINERNPIEAIVFDPRAEGNVLAQMIEDELNILIVEYSNDPKPMSEAAMSLGEAIRNSKISHPDNQELTNHMLACGPVPIAQGSDRWRIIKVKGGRKIDAAVALAMVRQSRMSKPKGKLDPSEFVVLAA